MSLEDVAVSLRAVRDALTAEERRKLFHVRGPGDYGGWATEVAEKYWPDQPEEKLSFVNVCGRAHVASYGMADRFLADDMAYDALATAARGLPAGRAEALTSECRVGAARMDGEGEPEIAQVMEGLANFVEEARAAS